MNAIHFGFQHFCFIFVFLSPTTITFKTHTHHRNHHHHHRLPSRVDRNREFEIDPKQKRREDPILETAQLGGPDARLEPS